MKIEGINSIWEELREQEGNSLCVIYGLEIETNEGFILAELRMKITDNENGIDGDEDFNYIQANKEKILSLITEGNEGKYFRLEEDSGGLGDQSALDVDLIVGRTSLLAMHIW